VITLNLIKVNRKRLGGHGKGPDWDGQTVFYSSRVRTLLDAVYDWSRFGALPRAYRWIRDDLRAGRVAPDKLVDATLKFGTSARSGAWGSCWRPRGWMKGCWRGSRNL
jgi:hypothetical protein